MADIKRIISEKEAEELRAKGKAVPKLVIEDKDENAQVQSLTSEQRLQACRRLWTIRQMFLSLCENDDGEVPMASSVKQVLRADYGKPHNGAVDVFLENAWKEGEVRTLPSGAKKVQEADGAFARALEYLADPWTTDALFAKFVEVMKTDAAESGGLVPRGSVRKHKMAVYAQNTRAITASEARTGKAEGPAGPLGRASQEKVAGVWRKVAEEAGATKDTFDAWDKARKGEGGVTLEEMGGCVKKSRRRRRHKDPLVERDQK